MGAGWGSSAWGQGTEPRHHPDPEPSSLPSARAAASRSAPPRGPAGPALTALPLLGGEKAGKGVHVGPVVCPVRLQRDPKKPL